MLLLTLFSSAQTTIKGKVTDSSTGDPIPLANVYFQGTQTGVSTDFDGHFILSTSKGYDSLIASYIGYKLKSKKISQGIVQVVNFQLEEDVVNLQEVVFLAGENPAFPIMREVIKSKRLNDKRSLEAYEYESYTKIEVDVDNINQKFKKSKVMRRITSVMDSIEQIAGEDGKPVLPILFSEAISKFHYKKNPRLRYENMIKNTISIINPTISISFE